MASTHYFPFSIPEYTSYAGVVITSGAAVAALTLPAAMPVFCVGESTAELARQKGFNVVYVAEGYGNQLAVWLANNIPPCHLLHACGRHHQTGWYTILRQAGFTVTAKVVYAADYITQLPANVLKAVASANIIQVALFSPQQAKHWARLMQRHHLPITQTVRWQFFVLSPAVAAAAPSGGDIFVADSPSLQSLLELYRRSISHDTKNKLL